MMTAHALRAWWRRAAIAGLTALAAPIMAQNRPESMPPAGAVEVTPIECWWKTDRSAVRVGEPFLLTLTCAVLDTDRAKVIVDESALAPSALHLVPFETVDGRRFRDVRYAPRRFFQYQYTMRVLGEEFFGKDVTLPRLQLAYRVQNTLAGGSALAGREMQYSLRPVPVRVLSLVPREASDIRDAPVDTFGDVEERLFRSTVLLIVGAVSLVFAALLTLWALARAGFRKRAAAAVKHHRVSPRLALRAASGELAAVQRESRAGWTGELAGRAAASARVAGAVALNRPIAHKPVAAGRGTAEGQIVARRRIGTRVAMSAAITPGSSADDGAAVIAEWAPIGRALRTFSEARYSRNGTVDATGLDAALADVQHAIKHLRLRHWWRFGRPTHERTIEHGLHTWTR